jgi:hypothetical protein
MTEPIDPGGSDAAPARPVAPITAQRAIAAPATVDRAARTVEVVWSTGARARNYVPPLGAIVEELDMSPNAVRMDGLRSGRAPVLDTHRRGGARDVLGRVVAARLEAGRGYATLQFSAAADVEPVWERITNHDDRASLVCALTALCVAGGDYVAVGDHDGWIILPPRRFIQDWAWRDLVANADGSGHLAVTERQ